MSGNRAAEPSLDALSTTMTSIGPSCFGVDRIQRGERHLARVVADDQDRDVNPARAVAWKDFRKLIRKCRRDGRSNPSRLQLISR